MQMLNPHCGVDRDPRGVVRLTICNAGSLNILGSAVINGVREGLEALATTGRFALVIIAGQSEKSMIGGADIKEMAKLDQKSAENSSPACAISARRARVSGAGDRADAGLVPRRRPRSRRRLRFPDRRARRQIRHARGPGRHSLGDPCRAVAAADRLGPRPLAGHDGGEYRRPTALAWGLVDVVAPEGGLDAAVERTVAALLECGPEALRAQKALLRQWEELPLTESVNLSIGVFGQSFLTGEPQRLMQGFIDRKR
jgi:enoyl-CoA hydratase